MIHTTPQSKVVPFLKWAGGKRWLVTQYSHLFPTNIQHLIEPFCGSSAIFFSLKPTTSTLSDTNTRLIEGYISIRDDVDKFVELFNSFASRHSRTFYYELRDKQFSDPTERAAQFVYLNRVCFNGIYRENLSGKFNVPLGSKDSAKLSTDDFYAVSNALASTHLLNCDFQQIIDNSKLGDLIYVDPPYVTKHNFNGFAKYNQKIFSWDDQERLANAVIRAHLRGVSIILSNADHPDVRALYEPHLQVFSLERPTVIASKSEYRGRTTEMVATNVF